MGAVEHRHVAVRHALAVQRKGALGDPRGLVVRALGMAPHRGAVNRAHGRQPLRHALAVLLDQRVRDSHHARRRPVVFQHHDGARAGEPLVEVQQVAHVSPAPGVDGLVGVAHHEQVLVVAGQHLHELVLQAVDVLELVHHDVLEPLLPFEQDVGVLLEQVQHEHDEVVVVQPEALLLLVEVAVEDDVARVRRVEVLLPQAFERHSQHVAVVSRALFQLHDLDHVARLRERHVPQGEPALLVDNLQHGIDVGVVQHEKALRVLQRVAVLLQHRHAEAVERVDVAGVVVARETPDAAAHLAGRLVRERGAQDVAGHDAQLVHQVGEAVRERPRLARAGPGDHAHVPLGSRDGLALRRVQARRIVPEKAVPVFRLHVDHLFHRVQYTRKRTDVPEQMFRAKHSAHEKTAAPYMN